MAKSAKGLGRGLGALLTEPETTLTTPEAKKTLPIQKLEPNRSQPRQFFDEEALAELAESIRQHGLIQPVVVRPLKSGYYQIIAGERRWRAARLAGLRELPVNIIEADDRTAAELALIENLQRENLNPIEEARGYRALIDEYAMSQEETADCVGKSRPTVTNALRLLKLSDDVLSMVESGALSAGHARALLGLEDAALQLSAAQQVIDRQLSVRQTEALVRQLLKPVPELPEPNILEVDYYKECEKDLSKKLGRSVAIRPGKKKGIFQLEYYGEEDLQRLIDLLSSLDHT